MPLTCSCECDDPPFWIWSPDDYSDMPPRKRRTRCTSCHAVLNEGDCVAKFTRSRDARSDVELNIYGEGNPESIWYADWFLCEECADLYFSLLELGFECVDPSENMRDLVQEYALTYGPQR